MGSAQDDEQLGRLASHQLEIGVGVCGAAAARVDVRRDQSGGRGALAALRAAPRTVRRIEKRRQLFAQAPRVAFVTQARVDRGALAGGVELPRPPGPAAAQVFPALITTPL